MPIAPLAIRINPRDEYLGNLKEEKINQVLTKKAKTVKPYLPISPESWKNPKEIPLFQTRVMDRKEVNLIEWYLIDGIDLLKYLIEWICDHYPINYGIIPQTILPISRGGDGDPLDVVILGEKLTQGTIIKVKHLAYQLNYTKQNRSLLKLLTLTSGKNDAPW